MNQLNNPPSLRIHEWMAVVLLIAAILFISLITQSGNPHLATQLNPLFQSHDVIVKGAVAYEGVYRISPEMTLNELLTICEVHPDADLRRFKLDNTIKKGRVLVIHSRKVIRVSISGAIFNPGIIVMYPGARYLDLADKVVLMENADASILKRKSLLKDNQKVDIPFLRKM